MSEKNPKDEQNISHIAVSCSEVSSVSETAKQITAQKKTTTSERQIKFERAQKCLENAAQVSKRIKEHRKATAELLGKPFDDDDADTASEMASTMSERTGYSAATDTSTTMSVQDALNIPGISESLANTLKQKEILMERIKHYKEISKRPLNKSSSNVKRDSISQSKIEVKKISENESVSKLQQIVKEKENALSVLQVKMKAMETTVLDLQEKINEKDQIIDSKNKATTIISDSLSKKEHDTFALLEDTRQQMTKMQENYISMESEWNAEKERLLKDIEIKDRKINSLQEENNVIENSRLEASVMNSKLIEEIESKTKEINHLQDQIKLLTENKLPQVSSEKDNIEQEKGAMEEAQMEELSKKIELLETINCQIRQTNKELESKLASTSIPEVKSTASSSPSKKGSPLPGRKGGGRSTVTKTKSPWSQLSSENLPQEIDKKISKGGDTCKLETVIQSLNKDILEKEYCLSQKDAIIIELNKKITDIEEKLNSLSSKQEISKVNVGITAHIPHEVLDEVIPSESDNQSTVVDVKMFEDKLSEAQKQIDTLNNDIDASNKNMIKVKSAHKLKLKQMQKTIDNLSKVSDANEEIVKLNEEVHQLTQKVAELEEEKGNLQLHLVDYDSGRLTESEVYKKFLEMENVAETRLTSISVLETQKFDLVQELHELQQKSAVMEDKLADLTQLQSEQVCIEMKSVQLEEQLDELIKTKKELEQTIDTLKHDNNNLNSTIKLLDEEKNDINQKLQQYLQENIELNDKLEKLSAEKVSSAESIEIVESLTTQEKLELEEYNRGMTENIMSNPSQEFKKSTQGDEDITKLVEESAELNKKIELFTQERQEVMDKMNKILTDNESLQQNLIEVTNERNLLITNIECLTTEKEQILCLNKDLNLQIEEMKNERIEIMKESVEISKPANIEELVECLGAESVQEEKLTSDKGNSKIKSVKQLTKEILKLKNIIKEREDEIADCQMKILSLEEHQQKQNEQLKNTIINESKIKTIADENTMLKEALENLKIEKETDISSSKIKELNESLQQQLESLRNEYTSTVNARDSRIQELQNVLVEYEKQIYNYSTSLQQKDKEMSEYVNQITKLNDVSQKLKSTIEMLEEEIAKDQNGELVKSLNKQITVYQKKLTECEEKINNLDEEKFQLLSVKAALEGRNVNLDNELKKLNENFTEKQNLIKELQSQQQKHNEEVAAIKLESKERDEEIHEIKLQLRKESIENEKLRNCLSEKEQNEAEYKKQLDNITQKYNLFIAEKDHVTEEYTSLENKNKELMEKLKKFALNIKKKAAMYTELENQFLEVQKQLESKNQYLDSLQHDSIQILEDKIKIAEENNILLNSQILMLEQEKSKCVNLYEDKIKLIYEDLNKLQYTLNSVTQDLQFNQEENSNLRKQIEALNNKIVEHEHEQKDNINYVMKISTLESEIIQKQTQITDLIQKNNFNDQELNQTQSALNAKLQEKDLYVENLEAEINRYKTRINRLEESVSTMEKRRHSIECKADELDSQLQEKQKAYSEYTSQEDELIKRLAVLMDHDRFLDKQLHEIESENKEMQYKLQNLNEENHRLNKMLSDFQGHCNLLEEKAARTDNAESELSRYQNQVYDLELNLKRISMEYQNLVTQKKQEIEEIEIEFNTQISNSLKEKKILTDRQEKLIEQMKDLEKINQDYKSNIEQLNLSIEELTQTNRKVTEETQQHFQAQDYIEQYIQEINRLNALINSKDQENMELKETLQIGHNDNVSKISTLEQTISNLKDQVQEYRIENDKILSEVHVMQMNYEKLQKVIEEKNQEINYLREKKKVTFEMNIPKTEGLLISSTIEPLSYRSSFDSIDSQIMTEEELVKQNLNPLSVEQSNKPIIETATEITEPLIIPKKSYLCYQEESQDKDQDPFNSEEGWGLGEEPSDNFGIVSSDLSKLYEKVQKLSNENEHLQTEVKNCNSKLQKAIKKIKELKMNNDKLVNDLNLSNKLSQSSILDNAIEDELRNNNQELEKKIAELTIDLNKYKAEKEKLKKQNDVFSNANDRLTDMKEKLDSEIQMWKFKFKEVNDNVSKLQWETDSPEHKPNTVLSHTLSVDESRIKEDILKLERENDELQSMVDQLTNENKMLLNEQVSLKDNINALNSQLEQLKESAVDTKNITELQNVISELSQTNNQLNHDINELQIRYNDIKEVCDNTKVINEEINNKQLDILKKNSEFENVIENLRSANEEAYKKIQSLEDEMKEAKSKLQEALLNENTNTINSSSGNEEIIKENTEFKDKIQLQENNISELTEKLRNLNIENDQLLSTVAELRSSVSSAVDQRGYEIAELWKQHLAQRESDFSKLEQELRTQITANESKYEQLLDNVQSSTQEETNQLIVMEQINSLQSKLQDKDDNLRDMQKNYAEVMNQLEMVRSEMEDEKLIYENKLLGHEEDYEKQMRDQLKHNQETLDVYEKKINMLEAELIDVKNQNAILIEEKSKLIDKANEAEERIYDLVNQIQLKDIDIAQKLHEYTIVTDQKNDELEMTRKKLLEYEQKLEELNYEKESELAVLRLQMHEENGHFKNITTEHDKEISDLAEELTLKINECTNLNKQVVELRSIIEEQSVRNSEMQAALENQELDIVTLNDELKNMQILLKSSSSRIEKHVTFASDTKPSPDANQSQTTDDSVDMDLFDAVPRAELDLALYMLHQRDVRCEELTLELTQLLEERDTLQLRLSDSLRSFEDLKYKFKIHGSEILSSPSPTQDVLQEASSSFLKEESADVHQRRTPRSSVSSNTDSDRTNLNAKLNELRTVNQNRDVTLKRESEQRQLGVRLMHRDIADLPPEAVGQLERAHHTLTRDSQSTPTVLLNWLRGKSTPKVMHM